MKIHWFFKVLAVSGTVFLFWVIFFYSLPGVLPAQRIESGEVYGLIFSDQVWGGEIRVTGDIYSLTNNTITVLPGTKILVAIEDDKSNLDYLPWHKKSGVNIGPFSKGVGTGEPFWDERQKIQIHLNNLIIKGEPSNQVTIRSNSARPSPFDFNVFGARRGFITNTNFSSYRRFETGPGLVVMNSNFKDIGECALCVNRGKPEIHNNIFENSLKESIWIEKASPKITSNLFINLQGDGIKIDSKKLSAPEITNNVFEMPQGVAINIISGGQVNNESLIAKNIFSGNSRINIACDAKVKIRDNVILGMVSFSTGCNGRFIFGPNFWGTPDPGVVISEKILNKYDKFAISIPTVLLSPPKEAGRK